MLRVNQEIENKWLYYLVQTNPIIEAANQSTGTKMPRAEWKTVGETKIAIPSTRAEQTAISTSLSDADALIISLEKLIAKKQAIKQGTMQSLLTGKKRLPGFIKKWESKRLGDIGECVIGLTYSPNEVARAGLLVLRSSNIENNRLKFEDNVFVSRSVSDKITTKEGDILICVRNGSRELIGKCAVITGKGVGQTFGAFMSLYRSPFNNYIFHVFQSSIIKKQIEENIGATINQITNKNLNAFTIKFPSIEEQESIARVLEDMNAEIDALGTKLAKYRKLKQGMMQNLLTGKIRLV